MARKNTYYGREKDVVDNGVTDIVKSIDDVAKNEDLKSNEVIENNINAKVLMCKVINITPKAVCIDFNGFGISIEVKNPQNYSKVNMIPVSYSGKIGTPDFKVWVD